MRVASLFAALSTILPTTTAAKEAPVVLEASSPWNLDYDKESCRLARQFGTGDDTVTLFLVKYAPGTNIEIMVSGKQLKSDGSRRFAYSFDPQDRRDVEKPLFGDLDDGATIWQFTGRLVPEDVFERIMAEADGPKMHAAEQEAASAVTGLTIARGVRLPVTLRTGRLSAAMASMDTCLDDLVKSWGFDPAEQRALPRRAEPVHSPLRWINYHDYPSEALRKDLAGMVRFRLQIDAAGEVTGCTIQSSYSHPDFPATVCKVFLKEGRFKPAKNAAGDAVASYWTEAVLFLPG